MPDTEGQPTIGEMVLFYPSMNGQPNQIQSSARKGLAAIVVAVDEPQTAEMKVSLGVFVLGVTPGLIFQHHVAFAPICSADRWSWRPQ